MSRNLFEKRKLEFIKIVVKEQRLPKVWEFKFADGEDMRVWFNQISKVERFKDFINEVNSILDKFGKKVLTDKEKEIEFLECINTIKHIPLRGEQYFSDNDEMYMWYMNYIKRNRDFETIVYINLPEYLDFDLESIWSLIEEEFISVIKQLKRIPNHGEAFLQNGIDVRVVFNKLATYNKKKYETILLHLQTYNKKGLSLEERIKQLKKAVSSLGYVPDIQEVRFSDGTDMFTWYTKYKNNLLGLEEEIKFLIHTNKPNKKVNIYLIPNFKSKGGKFYTICTNVGEKLDLSNIESYEDIEKLDSTIVKRGGVILKQDENIESVSFTKGKSK